MDKTFVQPMQTSKGLWTMYTISLKPRETMKDTKPNGTSCKWLRRIVFIAFLSYFFSRVGMSCLKLMEDDLGTIQKKAVAHKVRDGEDHGLRSDL